ncbi:MAG TPA: YicC/YloC family endoribonuclease [Candidatus Eisenbacteria bacterium]|nr:YicC/YloC family endoribonuclease [Candidatus Eisenbacteria bacterium]
MIRSMTGFGRGEVERGGRVLVAEARSVNHRFLEVSMRLPRGIQGLEPRLRARIEERVGRGKLTVTVAWKGQREDGGVLTVDLDLAERYVNALREFRNRFGFREPVTLQQVSTLPDLFKWVEPEVDAEDSWVQLVDVTDRALQELIRMRELEGETLAKDFRLRLDRVREALSLIEKRAPQRVTEAKDRLRSRVAELLHDTAVVDEERLTMEAAFVAERMDCTEECVRLRSHLDQTESFINFGGPVGRKLNFIAQEMHREANTIGAKAQDAIIATQVIVLKEEIEILREQVQNVE